jgi:large subunit ribosomal protein L9
MKVILTQTIKGKGKAGQTIEVPNGYGNFLIREQQAILASEEALVAKAEGEAKAQADETKLITQMRALATRLDGLAITIPMKVGAEGKTFGAVSSKQVIQGFLDQHNIELEKKKLDMGATINAIGRYDRMIQLHRTVTATLHVHVVEDK